MSVAVAIFIAFILGTLAITWWAHGRTRTAAQFYTADSAVTPIQNGLAIAGDYLSAASFLGTTAVFVSFGIDGLYYAVGAIAGWPVATCLIAERLRKLGRFTFADALCTRLENRPIRIMTSIGTVCICGAYLTAQMVGAGSLVQVLFQIPYSAAVILVGVLMTVYVMFGGMVATTWIQITKASLLILTALVMTFLVAHKFNLSIPELVDAAASKRAKPIEFLRSGGLIDGPMDAIGLALAFCLGPAGMPHILMRFFTVQDPRSARLSLVYATSVIGVFQLMVIVLGFGALALVATGPSGLPGSPGAANLAAVYLAKYLGGSMLFGVVAAVTFATILAVVSGLTLAATSAVSHDLYAHVICEVQPLERDELQVSRVATAAIGLIAIALGLLCRNQNIGFLATLPLVIAASCNFPVLVLALYWRRLTTRGAVLGGYTGLVLSVMSVVLGPKVWTGVLGQPERILTFDYGTAISLAAALFVAIITSRIDANLPLHKL